MSKEKVKEANCCGNCAYFDKFPVQKKESNVLGACKANPPLPGEINKETQKRELGVWPIVLGNFWCGVFTKFEE